MPSAPKAFHEAEAEYNRAAKSELSSDFSTAFRLYLSAADSFLHLTRSEPLNPAFHARCKAQAAKSLERAEKIKKASERPGAGIEIDVVPVDWFAQEQQHYVLRKSSVINGIRYPIWTDAVPNADIPVGVLYSDPDGQPAIPSYATSSTNGNPQLLSWSRLTAPRGTRRLSPYQLEASLDPEDIKQHMINDCSVCAVISVCLQHSKTFKSKLLVSSIYPSQQPGRYDFKVLINGIHRRVSHHIQR